MVRRDLAYYMSSSWQRIKVVPKENDNIPSLSQQDHFSQLLIVLRIATLHACMHYLIVLVSKITLDLL